MQEAWGQDFSARAQTWWTPQRTRQLIGDKQLPILPADAPVLLRALGLLAKDASMPPNRVAKYRQINHMLGAMRPALDELSGRFDRLDLIDAGCGRSYLTLLVAWWLDRQGTPVRILGIDRDPTVLKQCQRRAQAAGLDRILSFAAADLQLDLKAVWHTHFDAPLSQPHGLFSLHACDTATDDAIALAAAHDIPFIAVAPCCQAELAAAWARRADEAPPHPLAPLWRNPHLRRTAAATLTDTFRLLLLRACGYQTRATEFVEATHTPKNTLIRAIKRNANDPQAAVEYRTLRQATGNIGIALESRLPIP